MPQPRMPIDLNIKPVTDWIGTFKFDLFVTLAFNDARSPVQNVYFNRMVQRDRLRAWDARVNHALLGKRWARDRLNRIWCFHARLSGARYNPARRARYLHEHWGLVLTCISRAGARLQITGIEECCRAHHEISRPGKSDQDLLDAVLCAIVGVWWLVEDRSTSIMIGDLTEGYMIAPATEAVRERLARAARRTMVPVDGAVPTA